MYICIFIYLYIPLSLLPTSSSLCTIIVALTRIPAPGSLSGRWWLAGSSRGSGCLVSVRQPCRGTVRHLASGRRSCKFLTLKPLLVNFPFRVDIGNYPHNGTRMVAPLVIGATI